MGERRTVLITGASRGIGEAAALRLAARGWQVLAGVRQPEDGEALRKRGGASVLPIQLDVAEVASLGAARETVSRLCPGGLDGLVNNAGMVVAGPLETLPLDEIRLQFEVNFFGALELTRTLLPALRLARGRIVNVSSINGRVVSPFTTPYAASKFALEALSDGLRMELAPQGIRVSVIEPGAIATAIWETSLKRALGNAAAVTPETERLYGGLLRAMARRAGRPPAHAIPAERVARKIAHALEARRPRARYLVGWDARAAAALAVLLPTRLFDWLRT